MMDDRAARGFAAAEHYDAHRPSYPAEAVAFLREAAGITSDSCVVDLGAGSGLMTRLLRPVGRLIAVEPLAEMRAVLQVRVPDAEALAGTAEAIPLPTGSVDAVVTAQAFHWFATAETVREIARILTREGALVLVWNTHDLEDPVMERIEAILDPCRGGSPGYESTTWREVLEAKESPFAFTSHGTFGFREELTMARLKDRVHSASYIALLDEQRRQVVFREIETLCRSARGGRAGHC